MACENCPCPDICLQRKTYCEWAAKDPPEPRELRNICEASEMLGGHSEAVHVDRATGFRLPYKVAQYPSMAAQAGSAVRAAARFVAAGLPVVAPEEAERRQEICHHCEFYDPKRNRCLKCGCALAVKPWLKTEHCPLDPPKW